jgi:hypothetical protein
MGKKSREIDRLHDVLMRADQLLMLRLEKPHDYPLDDCLREVHSVITRGLSGENPCPRPSQQQPPNLSPDFQGEEL